MIVAVIFFALGLFLGWLLFRGSRRKVILESPKDSEIHELARSLAHEIRNPLNTIRMNLQLISEELGENERIKRRISLIEDEIKHLDMILKSFLDYTRLPAPKLERININKVVKNGVEMIQPRAGGIRIETSLAESLPMIYADKALITEVLQNLIQNALDASKSGDKIVVETGKSDIGVYFAVSDQGKGIPPEVMEKIFKPYFSTKQGGIGIGMAVVKKIVEAHNGKIWIQSRTGTGTRVVVELPIR